MLHKLRQAAFYILFAVLIAAFALVGGNYGYNATRSSGPLAKVGSVEVTLQQYQITYQRLLERLSMQMGRPISEAEARYRQIPTSVLQELIQNAATDAAAEKMGLGISQEGLRQSLINNPMFKGKSGAFDRDKYIDIAKQVFGSPQAFEQEYRADLVRRQISDLFDKSGVVSPTMLDALNHFINETRVIAYFSVDAKSAGDIQAPSTDDLQKYYDGKKTNYVTPELRTVSIVAISPETLHGQVPITDDELHAAYDKNKDSYGIPERRTIEMLPFQTKAAADAAAAKLKSGKTFAALVKEAGFKDGDVQVGVVSKKEFTQKRVINDAIVDAAFSLDKDKISAPVQGPLSTVIIHVSDIQPERIRSFDEVKDEIRNDLEAAKIDAEMKKLNNAFEENRNAGVPLTEIAKKLNLKLQEASISPQGRDADGKPVTISGVPVNVLVAPTFKSDVGVENDPLRLPGKGYAWFEISKIIKPKQKSFDEVKASVETAWKAQQTQQKVSEKAQELRQRIEKGEAMADVAKSVNAEVKTSKPLKRSDQEASLTPDILAQAFDLPVNGVAVGDSDAGGAQVILQVTAINIPAPFDAAAAKTMTQRIAQSIAHDNRAQYITFIKDKLGSSVDPNVLKSILGGGAHIGDDGE